MQVNKAVKQKDDRWSAFKRHMKKYWVLYLFLLPAVVDVFIFRYMPINGVQIAFRNYKIKKGIWGSDWVGFKYFIQFFKSPLFWPLMRNTLLISLYDLIFGFPMPILLAFLINEIRSRRAKKLVQMVTYMPHFISMVAVVGLVSLIVDRETGILNVLLRAIGREEVNFLGKSSAYRPIYIISEIWQHMGWNAIIYISALSTVDVEALEAAKVDGANRFQKIIYIDFPTILPTIVILFIMKAGTMLNVGFEKVFLLQNDLTRDVSQVINTFVYEMGILNGQFSYTTAIGLFNNVINAVILVLVNQISRRLSDTSLW